MKGERATESGCSKDAASGLLAPLALPAVESLKISSSGASVDEAYFFFFS